MAITDKQREFVDIYITGEKLTVIAKKIGVTRQSCYNWLNNDEVKSEIDRCLAEIKTQAGKKMSSKLDSYIDELERIAFKGKSEKVRASSLQYLVDRVLGKSTTKAEGVSNDDEDSSKVDIDKELKEIDNIIDIRKVK